MSTATINSPKFQICNAAWENARHAVIKKEKMQLIEKNVKLLASNITCSWSRWVRPNNAETNSKKNAKTKQEEQNEDEERKNTNGKKQKEKKKFKALMIEEKLGQ